MKRCLFVLAAICFFIGCRSVPKAEPYPRDHFAIVTYNVNWGGYGAEQAADIIRVSGADIVCLQETSPRWEQFLRDQLSKDYPFMQFRDSVGRMGGGLAFFSKVPAQEVAYIPSVTGWFDGWIVQFETLAGPVQVLNVHLRPPVSDRGSWVSGYFITRDDRVAELERFYSRKREGVPLLVAGDFDDSENSPVVGWLERRGMRNALTEFDASTATWHCKYRGISLSRRMDHVFYPPELKCLHASVIEAGASDHYPVIAILSKALP